MIEEKNSPNNINNDKDFFVLEFKTLFKIPPMSGCLMTGKAPIKRSSSLRKESEGFFFIVSNGRILESNSNHLMQSFGNEFKGLVPWGCYASGAI